MLVTPGSGNVSLLYEYIEFFPLLLVLVINLYTHHVMGKYIKHEVNI